MSRYRDYHLPGMFWDGMPIIPYTSITIFKTLPFIADWRMGNSLFDFHGKYERRINITDLLKANKREDIDKIVNAVTNCTMVYLMLDYIPLSCNKMLSDLYWKRVLQMSYYISLKMKYSRKLTLLVPIKYSDLSIVMLTSARYYENIA